MTEITTAIRLEKLREKAKAKEAMLREKHKAEYVKTRTAVAVLENDVNFQIFLRHLCKITGFWKSSVVLNQTTNEVNAQSTLVNEGRRSVYLDLRKMLSDEARRQTETKLEEFNV